VVNNRQQKISDSERILRGCQLLSRHRDNLGPLLSSIALVRYSSQFSRRLVSIPTQLLAASNSCHDLLGSSSLLLVPCTSLRKNLKECKYELLASSLCQPPLFLFLICR
jgi:hypothetical protein